MRTSDTKPSRAERTAQQWHAEWHRGRVYGECWCCCRTCKIANPHYRAGCRAAWADIKARIEDSVANARPAKPGLR